MPDVQHPPNSLLRNWGAMGKSLVGLFLGTVALLNLGEGFQSQPPSPLPCITGHCPPPPPQPFQPPALFFVIRFPLLTIALLAASVLVGIIGSQLTHRRILLFLPLFTGSLIALVALVLFPLPPTPA
jgi:hypothetical protein